VNRKTGLGLGYNNWNGSKLCEVLEDGRVRSC